jgi:prepilin signal peptidase PulO-like enzyme (type II secretory pathway)
MDLNKRKRCYLQIALVLIGSLFLSLYPLMKLWPTGWVWLPRQHEYEQMMIGVYATLGIFLIWSARRPEAHFSLIWFAFWSSLVHGIIMGAQAIMDPAERGHLMGDVAALFIAVVLLGWLTPRERFARTTDKEDSKAAEKRLNS